MKQEELIRVVFRLDWRSLPRPYKLSELFGDRLISNSALAPRLRGSVSLLFHTCVYRDPIYFPGFAAIIRERLLKTARRWRDVHFRQYRGHAKPELSVRGISKPAARLSFHFALTAT